MADVAFRADPTDTARAGEHAAAAMALAEELELRPLAAHCHLTLGRAGRLAGQTDSARRHISTAAALFREMDMARWLAEAESELQRTG
jgi:hypothetical protein